MNNAKTILEGLVWFPIRAEFAESVCESYSGGVNELEMGGLCTSKEAADSLENKIRQELQRNNLPDISLYLTKEEAMCLAVASQNCQTNGLPKTQQDRIERWHKIWCAEFVGAYLELEGCC